MDDQNLMEGEAGTRPTVVFLHIPKTAGTAVRMALTSLYTADETCPDHQPEAFDASTEEELARWRLFSAHLHWDQLVRLPAPRILVTFLRDPRERLLSLYYYFHAFRWSVINQDPVKFVPWKLAKELSLGAYLASDHRLVRSQVDNVITRRLLDRARVNPSIRLLSDEEAVDLAIQHLQEMDVIGLAERTRESVMMIRARTGLEMPYLERVNDLESLVSTEPFEPVERQTIDGETEAEIQRCIRLDVRVYEWACQEFDRRVGELAVRETD